MAQTVHSPTWKRNTRRVSKTLHTVSNCPKSRLKTWEQRVPKSWILVSQVCTSFHPMLCSSVVCQGIPASVALQKRQKSGKDQNAVYPAVVGTPSGHSSPHVYCDWKRLRIPCKMDTEEVTSEHRVNSVEIIYTCTLSSCYAFIQVWPFILQQTLEQTCFGTSVNKFLGGAPTCRACS